MSIGMASGRCPISKNLWVACGLVHEFRKFVAKQQHKTQVILTAEKFDELP
jgi:hypothetical protein